MRREHVRRFAATTVLVVFAAALIVRTPPVPTQPPPQPPAAAPTQPAPSPSPEALLAPGRPVAATPGILGWALLDVASGTTLAEGPCTGCTNHAASTIKIWLAGNALRQADTDATTGLIDMVDAAVVDSDNNAATSLWALGGRRTGLWNMVHTCHLTRTLPGQDWGSTLITAGDLALLGVCTVHGDVAGPWTPLLLDRMRTVAGPGRFGPVDALPPGTVVAMKNGWVVVGGEWHVNCLAIVDNSWSLGIITRYPAALGVEHGAQLCATVTRQLATPRRRTALLHRAV